MQQKTYIAIWILCSLLFSTPVHSKEGVKLKLGAKGKGCLECHVTFKEKANKTYVHTELKNGNCSSCHDPHTSSHKNLLITYPDKLCYDCHKEILPEKALSVHKIVSEGQCNKCHDSHGSNIKYQLVNKGNELCFSCHQDVRKQMKTNKFNHAPLAKDKGCLNCHTPHASSQQKSLLKESTPGMCTKCHNTGNSQFKIKHMNYPVAESDCISCHNPHGSNTRGLLFDNPHSPVNKKTCTECHEASTASNPLTIKKQSKELCGKCHEKMLNETFDKKRLHWPVLDSVGCMNCHTPHAAKQKKLLKASIIDVCGKCHSDTVELQKWSKMNPLNKKLCEPVKSGNCVICHSPHAADYPLLFEKQSINKDLCGRCHAWQTHSTHPIGEKIIDHRNKNLTLDCLSCHKACGTQNNPVMLHFQTTYELCIQCHTDRKR
ncbi:MAG: cytochrome C [Desulfobacterium sp.]|nr:cytochrome C [Desulfobacterium sp.]